jgi:hypothetical protein
VNTMQRLASVTCGCGSVGGAGSIGRTSKATRMPRTVNVASDPTPYSVTGFTLNRL